MQLRHSGEWREQLHSFLNSALAYALVALPTGRNKFFFNNIRQQKYIVTLVSSLVHVLCVDVKTNVIFQFAKILSPYGLRHVWPQVGRCPGTIPPVWSSGHVLRKKKEQSQGRSTAKHCLNPYDHKLLSDVTCCNTCCNTIHV